MLSYVYVDNWPFSGPKYRIFIFSEVSCILHLFTTNSSHIGLLYLRKPVRNWAWAWGRGRRLASSNISVHICKYVVTRNFTAISSLSNWLQNMLQVPDSGASLPRVITALNYKNLIFGYGLHYTKNPRIVSIHIRLWEFPALHQKWLNIRKMTKLTCRRLYDVGRLQPSPFTMIYFAMPSTNHSARFLNGFWTVQDYEITLYRVCFPISH